MSFIADFIEQKNNENEKILSVFLTCGYPAKESFVNLALKILNAGSDMLEIGFPFSDPLADGPIIQHSSQMALEAGINLDTTFQLVKEIRRYTEKPLILMGYANPVLSYGTARFAVNAKDAGANGVIIPDIPIEEYDTFFDETFAGLDTIMLVTPTSANSRIVEIDKKSSGFVYCVSVSGTTGVHHQLNDSNLDFIANTSQLCKNKTLVGFGISSPESAERYKNVCNGVIVGSAVIKSVENDDDNFTNTIKLIKEIKSVLKD